MREWIASLDRRLREYGGQPIEFEKEPYVVSSSHHDDLRSRLAHYQREQHQFDADDDSEDASS